MVLVVAGLAHRLFLSGYLAGPGPVLTIAFFRHHRITHPPYKHFRVALSKACELTRPQTARTDYAGVVLE